ncbi:hypothetical protein PCE1_003895 [Barthelona sp. PCE]
MEIMLTAEEEQPEIHLNVLNPRGYHTPYHMRCINNKYATKDDYSPVKPRTGIFPLLEPHLIETYGFLPKQRMPTSKSKKKKRTKTKQRRPWRLNEERRFSTAINVYGTDPRLIAQYLGTREVWQVRSHLQKFQGGIVVGDKNASHNMAWTESEKIRFSNALIKYGKGAWKDISAFVGTRSALQVKNFSRRFYLSLDADSWAVSEVTNTFLMMLSGNVFVPTSIGYYLYAHLQPRTMHEPRLQRSVGNVSINSTFLYQEFCGYVNHGQTVLKNTEGCVPLHGEELHMKNFKHPVIHPKLIRSSFDIPLSGYLNPLFFPQYTVPSIQGNKVTHAYISGDVACMMELHCSLMIDATGFLLGTREGNVVRVEMIVPCLSQPSFFHLAVDQLAHLNLICQLHKYIIAGVYTISQSPLYPSSDHLSQVLNLFAPMHKKKTVLLYQIGLYQGYSYFNKGNHCVLDIDIHDKTISRCIPMYKRNVSSTLKRHFYSSRLRLKAFNQLFQFICLNPPKMLKSNLHAIIQEETVSSIYDIILERLMNFATQSEFILDLVLLKRFKVLLLLLQMKAMRFINSKEYEGIFDMFFEEDDEEDPYFDAVAKNMMSRV